MIIANEFRKDLKNNPRVAHLKLKHFKPFSHRQLKKINWYDAFMDFAQHGNFSILGIVKRNVGDHFPFLQWTFSILTINIATPQNLKNIEQMYDEIKVHMYNFAIFYSRFCQGFKVHHGLTFDYFAIIFSLLWYFMC